MRVQHYDITSTARFTKYNNAVCNIHSFFLCLHHCCFLCVSNGFRFAKEKQNDGFGVMLQCSVAGNDLNYDMSVEKTLFLLKLFGEKHSWKLYHGREILEKAKLRSTIKKLLPQGHLWGLLKLPEMENKAVQRNQALLVNHLAVYAPHSPKYRSLSWFASARVVKSAWKYGVSSYTNLVVVQLESRWRSLIEIVAVRNMSVIRTFNFCLLDWIVDFVLKPDTEVWLLGCLRPRNLQSNPYLRTFWP